MECSATGGKRNSQDACDNSNGNCNNSNSSVRNTGNVNYSSTSNNVR